MNEVESIARGADGAIWSLCSLEPAGGMIVRMNTQGKVTAEFPLTGALSQAFLFLPLMAAGSDGNIWFSSGIQSIEKVTSSGVFTSYPVSKVVLGMTEGPDGALWFTGALSSSGITDSTIGRFTTEGQLTEYPLPDPAGDPDSITAGPDSALWFTEDGDNRVGRITTAGQIFEYPLPRTSGELYDSITTGRGGALWFTEFHSDRIGRITTHGQVSEYAVPTKDADPDSITQGSDGSLWFTEVGSDKIGRITLT